MAWPVLFMPVLVTLIRLGLNEFPGHFPGDNVALTWQNDANLSQKRHIMHSLEPLTLGVIQAGLCFNRSLEGLAQFQWD